MLPTEFQPCFQISATLVLTASQYRAFFSTLGLLRAPSYASTYLPASLAKRTMATKDRTLLPGTLLLIGIPAMSIESRTGVMRYSGSRLGPSREECTLLGTKCTYAGTCIWLQGNLHVSGVTTVDIALSVYCRLCYVCDFACLPISLLFSLECRILSIFRYNKFRSNVWRCN